MEETVKTKEEKVTKSEKKKEVSNVTINVKSELDPELYFCVDEQFEDGRSIILVNNSLSDLSTLLHQMSEAYTHKYNTRRLAGYKIALRVKPDVKSGGLTVILFEEAPK